MPVLDRDSILKLFRYGCALTRDEHAAYDLLQDAIETTLRKPPAHQKAIHSYIRTVMRNRYIDGLRRDQLYPVSSLDDCSNVLMDIDANVLEDVLVAKDEVEKLMEGLSPIERELLFLWAVEGYSTQEIASQTGSPRGTVLSRLFRIRKKVLDAQDARGRLVKGAQE